VKNCRIAEPAYRGADEREADVLPNRISVELAASEAGLAGAIAQCPLVDGLAGAMKIPPSRGLRLAAHALADLVGSALGREPHRLQVSVPPGEFGVIATDDAMTGHARLNPGDGSWPNDITARSGANSCRRCRLSCR
jgi:uncharacterized protein